MNDVREEHDAIDRFLGEEEVVRPSSDFTARVMRRVRTEAQAPEPIEFPWRRFLPGMLTSLSLTLGTFMVLGWFAPDLPAEPRTARAAEILAAVQAALATPTGVGLACAGAALLLSAATAWWATRSAQGSTGGF